MARKRGILRARLAKIAVALCALCILTLAPKPSQAGLPPMSAVMIDAKTGQTLYAQNADAPRYPASLTKLMTLYLLFEALRDHRITLNQMMPVSVHAASVEPVKLGVRPGARLTVQEAILGMVTLSANDAATVAGEFLAGGDETRFGALMTLKAHSLGMTHTVFHNASGLPDPAQVTTAHDLAILARRLVEDFPDDYPYFSTPSFVFHGRIINNHDHLLKSYPGADGMKTGYTNAAGHNLVTSALRGGVRLIGVVMAAPSNSYRDHQMALMLDQGFASELGGNARVAMVNAAAAARQAQSQAMPVVPASDPTVTQAHQQIASNSALGRADWNLDLGNYTSKSAAYTALRIASREAQGGVIHLVTLHTKSRHPAWHAWVASVTESHARVTCSAMSHYGRTCVAVRPGDARRNREVAER
jgi:D-alanyl-D-alanine carboxypeptidase